MTDWWSGHPSQKWYEYHPNFMVLICPFGFWLPHPKIGLIMFDPRYIPIQCVVLCLVLCLHIFIEIYMTIYVWSPLHPNSCVVLCLASIPPKMFEPQPDATEETWSGEGSAELVSTSETRNPKPETRNRLLKLVSNCETRNPKPETRNRLWRLTFPRTDRNPKPETRNRLLKLVSNCETRNPKPETRNRLWRLTFPRTDRNPKPETRNRLLKLVSNCETRNPKPKTRNRLFPDRNPKPETRNPKPETDSEDLPSPWTDRNPKLETRNRQRKLVSSDETWNPKPETDSESWFQSTKPETRNPKPETDSNPTFGWLPGSELQLRYIRGLPSQLRSAQPPKHHSKPWSSNCTWCKHSDVTTNEGGLKIDIFGWFWIYFDDSEWF